MNKSADLFGFFGFIFLIYGLTSAIFYQNVNWYLYFVLGGTFFFCYLNYNKKESMIRRLEKNKFRVLKTYFYYLIIGILIELIGRFILSLWYYPNLNGLNEIIQIFLIFYPFGLFFIYETFIFINEKINNFSFSILMTTLASAFLHEFPNTFALEWVYTIPYIGFSILNINIVVIVGWIILILIPVYINHMIKNKFL